MQIEIAKRIKDKNNVKWNKHRTRKQYCSFSTVYDIYGCPNCLLLKTHITIQPPKLKF